MLHEKTTNLEFVPAESYDNELRYSFRFGMREESSPPMKTGRNSYYYVHRCEFAFELNALVAVDVGHHRDKSAVVEGTPTTKPLFNHQTYHIAVQTAP